MKKNFKQENGYGCGLYALANAFQEQGFINEKRLAESKDGNNIGQLNKWLLEQGKDFFLAPVYFSSRGKKLPKFACQLKISGDDVFGMPILLDIQFSQKSKAHIVAAELTINGDLIVIDSLKDEPYITTISEFNKSNYRVYGLWYFVPYSGEGVIMRFNP